MHGINVPNELLDLYQADIVKLKEVSVPVFHPYGLDYNATCRFGDITRKTAVAAGSFCTIERLAY